MYLNVAVTIVVEGVEYRFRWKVGFGLGYVFTDLELFVAIVRASLFMPLNPARISSRADISSTGLLICDHAEVFSSGVRLPIRSDVSGVLVRSEIIRRLCSPHVPHHHTCDKASLQTASKMISYRLNISCLGFRNIIQYS